MAKTEASKAAKGGLGDKKVDNTDTIRNRVVLEKDRVENVASSDFPGTYAGIDDAWNMNIFKKNARMEITSMDPECMEIDIVGIDASLANALRRILIAEVPTVAIEDVYLLNNTSIIQDEVLCHRLGLVPLHIDPYKFEFKEKEGEATDLNTVVFKLDVSCVKNPNVPEGSSKGDDKYINGKILSSQLTWEPHGAQEVLFGEDPIRPQYDDILLAKLRPGQEISCEMHCRKGVGRDHIKWSPVGTASYRLLPEIILKRDFFDEEAEQLQKCFAPGVIELEEVSENNDKGRKKGAKSSGNCVKAMVADPRKCTMSREVKRHENLADDVVVQRVRDHFLFGIEPVGYADAPTLLKDALLLLKAKCQRTVDALDLYVAATEDDDANSTKAK
eukprot:Nk52_evm17s2241 gene=Nk52_evmTU17s2241